MSNTMKRFTKDHGKGYCIHNDHIDETKHGYSGEAVDRLAIFENIWENIIGEQDKISKELEKLRVEGKEKSVKFKELMMQKLNNANVISLFNGHGLD